MPQLSNDPAGFLTDLKSFLAKNPKDGYQELAEVPKRLNEFSEIDQSKVHEEAGRILGNAVGNQRTQQSLLGSYFKINDT